MRAGTQDWLSAAWPWLDSAHSRLLSALTSYDGHGAVTGSMVMGCEAGVQMTPQIIVISNLNLSCAGMYNVSRPGDRSWAAAECDKCGCSVVGTRGQGTTDQWSQAELFLLSPSPVCLARPGPTNCAAHWAMVDTCEPPRHCLAAPPPLYIPGQCLVTPSMVEWRPGVPSLGPLQCPAVLHLL